MKNYNALSLFLVVLIFNSIVISTNQQMIKNLKLKEDKPEYLYYYSGRGHILDCLNTCKKCIDDSVIKRVYYKVKEKGDFKLVPKDILELEIQNELNSMSLYNVEDYTDNVYIRTEFEENELNPQKLFRIYFDFCIIHNKAFYA